jgi:hypothetical protein
MGGGLTLDSIGYGTPSLNRIPLARWYATVSLCMGKLRILRSAMLLLILTISMTSNILYDQRSVWVRDLGRRSPKKMFDVGNVGIISSACICNRR